MDASRGGVRSALSGEVASLCLIIFLADIVFGIVTPSFSLFAREVGVSLAALGVINTLGGLTQLATSLPLGVLSDRAGRTRVFMLGLALFSLAMAAYAAATGGWLLAFGRIVQGLAGVAVFQIGAAYLGDITEPEQRAVAFGSYTTAMGLGFTVGPLLGGWIADAASVRVAYVVAAGVGALALVLAQRLLHERPIQPTATRANPWRNLGLLARRWDLTLVAIGNLLVSFTFSGAITTFLPLYAKDVGISQATIGTMFAVRALVSAAGRIPNSVITRRVGDQPVLLGALLVLGAVAIAIGATSAVLPLTLLMAVDGLAYGGYLVAGQTFVANHTETENRGAAVGLYSTFGNLGGVAGPLALAAVASRWSVSTVFPVTGAVLLLGGAAVTAGTLAIVSRGAAQDQPGF